METIEFAMAYSGTMSLKTETGLKSIRVFSGQDTMKEPIEFPSEEPNQNIIPQVYVRLTDTL